MPHPGTKRVFDRRRLPLTLLLTLLVILPACKRTQPAGTEQLDQAGMWFNNVAELRALNVSNAEIGELAKARDAGLSDPSCVVLIQIARSRRKPFADGQSIADLLSAGSAEQTVLELARLNQLGIWAGQAQALRLTGLSDKLILAVAQRRAQGLPVLSGEKLAELRNTAASEATILDMIQKGVTEEEASNYIAQRERAAGGHGFVYQGHARNKN